MNLNAVAGPVVAAVNPPQNAMLRTSTGYTTAADGTRTPAYTDASVTAQVQALNAADIRQLEALNIQDVERKAWLNGDVEGVDRAAGKGGDLLIVGSVTWLITHVFETWEAGWCAVGITKQVGSA